MRVLDLFSGLRGWSDPWKERGHEVVTLDLEPSFEADIAMDIREFARYPHPLLGGRYGDPWWKPDVILASPPCEAFSVMTIGRNWTLDHKPKTPKAELALELVHATLETIRMLQPVFWVIENPRAKLRRLMPEYVDDRYIDRVTVTYCQYGEPYMKPTDLWGGFPPSWWPRPPCKNGDPCHVAAVRGSRTGIQGESALGAAYERMASKPTTSRTKFRGGMIEVMARFPSWSAERKALTALRAKIPAELSLSLCEAAERDLLDGRSTSWSQPSPTPSTGSTPGSVSGTSSPATSAAAS